MHRVDVVVPCYQYGRFLRECVSSVLTQDVPGLRVLIIDNASTDDSPEVARELAREDRRVEVVVHQENLGATRSYNEGIEWASAEYFVLLDADDRLAPGCLARALAIMDAHPGLSFTHGDQLFLLPDGTTESTLSPADAASPAPRVEIMTGRRFIADFCDFPVNRVGAPTVVRRTAMQRRAGFYRPELPFTDDVEMWLRLAAVGDVGRIGALQGVRRMHAAQISAADQHSILRDLREREAAVRSFVVNDGHLVEGADRLLARARRRLGERAYWTAAAHLCRGRVTAALRLLAFAIARRPESLVVPPFGFFLRDERPMARVLSVLGEMAGRLGMSAGRSTA